ncbi:hypothetical protein HPP92_004670 [Vanilla planifolia]|uniref:Uncharacterized protein n=1 Tax=Vanilla planifolia TaxID=51239 RepID=A0A835VA93_VANPL|nr:hypothetical protein HPP92_004670 [Vanilla planifolia]
MSVGGFCKCFGYWFLPHFYLVTPAFLSVKTAVASRPLFQVFPSNASSLLMALVSVNFVGMKVLKQIGSDLESIKSNIKNRWKDDCSVKGCEIVDEWEKDGSFDETGAVLGMKKAEGVKCPDVETCRKNIMAQMPGQACGDCYACVMAAAFSINVSVCSGWWSYNQAVVHWTTGVLRRRPHGASVRDRFPACVVMRDAMIFVRSENDYSSLVNNC